MDSLTLDIALEGERSKNLETVKKLNLWFIIKYFFTIWLIYVNLRASDLSDISLVKEMPNLEILVLRYF